MVEQRTRLGHELLDQALVRLYREHVISLDTVYEYCNDREDIAKITGELGEYSTPSPPGVPTPPAIDLIDDSCLYVKAPMDEIDAPKIHSGQAVRISLVHRARPSEKLRRLIA